MLDILTGGTQSLSLEDICVEAEHIFVNAPIWQEKQYGSDPYCKGTGRRTFKLFSMAIGAPIVAACAADGDQSTTYPFSKHSEHTHETMRMSDSVRGWGVNPTGQLFLGVPVCACCVWLLNSEQNYNGLPPSCFLFFQQEVCPFPLDEKKKTQARERERERETLGERERERTKETKKEAERGIKRISKRDREMGKEPRRENEKETAPPPRPPNLLSSFSWRQLIALTELVMNSDIANMHCNLTIFNHIDLRTAWLLPHPDLRSLPYMRASFAP